MYSSDKQRERKERILNAHNMLLFLDNNDYHGTIKLSFKRGEGLMTYTLEEHGKFDSVTQKIPLAIKVVKNK